jgi:hypothetical protein
MRALRFLRLLLVPISACSLAPLCAALAGCGDDGGTSGTPVDTPDADLTDACGAACLDAGVDAEASVQPEAEAGAQLPPPICHPGNRWTAGKQTFRDATSDFGLDAVGAQGIRLDAVDFDGDGWADLIVRLNGIAGDDFAAGGKRVSWLLRNNGHGKFEDVTKSSGFRQNRTATNPDVGRGGEVIVFGDVDNDGDLDAYTGLSMDPAKPNAETSELLINNGDGTFSLGPENSPLRRKPPLMVDVPAGAAFLDFDRDGNLDLWVAESAYDGEPQQDRLYKGDGTGNFTDVTNAMGLTTKPWASLADLNNARAHSYAWSATACDLNNDGNPDLLAASYGRAPNLLWQNGGPDASFHFTNRSIESGYAFDDRMDWTDNESARCWCKLHPTAEDCTGVPPPQYIVCNQDSDAFRWNHTYDREPFRLGGNSAATLCGDVDNDGWTDLVTTEIVHWDVGSSSDPAELLVNVGASDITFSRPGNASTGLARTRQIPWDDGIMSGALFDFDNDGWLDLYWGNSDYTGNVGLLYHQDAPAHFEAVPTIDGIDHRRSHGSAVADFDHDGDLDIVVGHSFARCDGECYPTQQVRFFENITGQDGNFIELALTGGPGTNRSAIGARVTVTAGGVTQIREVGGGYGHYGAQDDLVVHVGLGDACEADVTIRWPDATLSTQTMTLPAGYRFAIVQGQAPVVVFPTVE